MGNGDQRKKMRKMRSGLRKEEGWKVWKEKRLEGKVYPWGHQCWSGRGRGSPVILG
jgi:hypothetical protein